MTFVYGGKTVLCMCYGRPLLGDDEGPLTDEEKLKTKVDVPHV